VINSIFAKFGLLTIENFLEADLCSRLCAEGRIGASFQATVSRKGMATLDEDVRRTKAARIGESAIGIVRSRLLDLKPSLEAHFKASLTRCSEPHILIYRPGDFFHPHRDDGDDPMYGEDIVSRQVSVVIFLNDESKESKPGCFGGGALAFYGLLDDPRGKAIGFPLAGAQGLLVAFPSDRVHQVTPVTHGERFTIVTWFH